MLLAYVNKNVQTSPENSVTFLVPLTNINLRNKVMKCHSFM